MNILPAGKKIINAALGKFGYSIHNSTYLAHLKNEIDALREENAIQKQRLAYIQLPPIVLSTLPKSGSGFFQRILEDSLGLMPVHFDDSDFILDSSMLSHLKIGNRYLNAHIDATHKNIILLTSNIKKMIVNIRDPRNAMVSMIHWIDYQQKNGLFAYNNKTRLQLKDVYQMDFDEKFKIFFDIFYKIHMHFLNRWFKVLNIEFNSKRKSIFTMTKPYSEEISDSEDPPCSTEVLLTTHEDIVNLGEEKIFETLLNFYEIPTTLFRYKLVKKDMETSRFRTGRTDSWKTELNSEQQEQVTSLVPREWCTYFGWDSTTARSEEREQEVIQASQ